MMSNPKFGKILLMGLINIDQKKQQEKISIFSNNLCTKIEPQIIE